MAQAEAAYRRAADDLPDPARARLGLAQVRLIQAQRDCGNRADVEALRRAVARFSAIGREPPAGGFPGRALLLRARLGQARGDLCLSLAGGWGGGRSQSTGLVSCLHWARMTRPASMREKTFATMIELLEDPLYERPPPSRTAWGRTDPLPPGVRRQLLAFYGIGDVVCNPREPAAPRDRDQRIAHRQHPSGLPRSWARRSTCAFRG